MVKKIAFGILWFVGIALTFPGLVFLFEASQIYVFFKPYEGLFFWIFTGVYVALEILFPILRMIYKKRVFIVVSIVLFVLALIPVALIGGYSVYLLLTGQFHWC